MKLIDQIPKAWREEILSRLPVETLAKIEAFLAQEEANNSEVFPPLDCRFSALESVSPSEVRAVILGQDPYHDIGQAHGLAFSVPDGIKIPPSLRNIFKELSEDLEIANEFKSGDLSNWAKQGVLLLNATLTVRAHSPLSHSKQGWEEFTTAIISAVASQPQAKVFLLWGGYAQAKRSLIDESRDLVLMSAHPSPLSAYRGFFGCRHFSKANQFLEKNGSKPIDWQDITVQQLKLEI